MMLISALLVPNLLLVNVNAVKSQQIIEESQKNTIVALQKSSLENFNWKNKNYIALSAGLNFTRSDRDEIKEILEDDIDWLVGFIFRNTHPAGCNPKYGSGVISSYENNMSEIDLEITIKWTGCFWGRREQTNYYFTFNKEDGTSMDASTTGINSPNYRGFTEIEDNMNTLFRIGPDYY